ncbi:hypothetical protein [Ponticaulis profundi]|uniref:Uncharacterized protein n=1 Tax=Ponticaulis profundi TaxID=2665222 RepID=A0ABW1SBY0_9PROT
MFGYSLELIITLVGLVFGVGLFFLSSHRAGLPRDDMRPRVLPWRLFIVLSAFWTLLMLVHLVNIFGIETGPDKSPFMRF